MKLINNLLNILKMGKQTPEEAAAAVETLLESARTAMDIAKEADDTYIVAQQDLDKKPEDKNLQQAATAAATVANDTGATATEAAKAATDAQIAEANARADAFKEQADSATKGLEKAQKKLDKAAENGKPAAAAPAKPKGRVIDVKKLREEQMEKKGQAYFDENEDGVRILVPYSKEERS